MARKKKRAWNMSNPLYRYLHGKKAKVRKVKVKTKRTRGVRMAKKRFSRGKSKGMGGLMQLVKYATIGIGSASVVNQVTGGKEYTPFFHELAGAGATYALTKSVKGAVVGGVSVAVLKNLPNLMGNVGASTSLPLN
jgi:hypothetical protein